LAAPPLLLLLLGAVVPGSRFGARFDDTGEHG
jgi:hypothetical protein